MTTSSPTKERAQEAASTAADEGRHVAGVAKDEAANVASEAAAQARNLVGEATSQVTSQLSDQSRTQRDNLVGTLKSFSDDLEKMASGEGGPTSGLATDVAREVASRARSISSAIDGREPQEILEDVRSFARRRPGMFLLGALAAGVVAGRVARGAKQASSDPSISGPSTPTTASSATTASTAPAAPSTTGTAAMPIAENPVTATNAPHGQPTIESNSGSALEADGPMGSPAAGYGERGATGPERPL